jgi:hypothetical protein
MTKQRNQRAKTQDEPQCIYGAAAGDRCPYSAAAGFDYCRDHGEFFGAYLTQLAPGHPDREKLKAEKDADKAAS